MCRLFLVANPESYTFVTRKLRIQGHSTSIRLEKGFWTVFERIAEREGRSLTRLLAALYDEVHLSNPDITNFASCLRVLALHYVIADGGRPASPCQADAASGAHSGGGWDSQFAALRFAGRRLSNLAPSPAGRPARPSLVGS